MSGSAPQSPEENAAEGSGPHSSTPEERRVQKPEKVNKGRFCTQFYCCLTACIGAMFFGIVLGWSRPAIRRYNEHGETNNTASVKMATLPALGCSMGSLVFSIMSEHSGPRKVLLLITPIQASLWTMIASSGVYLRTDIVITILGSMSVGFIVCGEDLARDSIHSSHINNFLIMFNSSKKLGILFAYMFGNMAIHSHYCLAITGALIALLWPMVWFLPESPVFLYKKSPIKSENALIRLRGKANIEKAMSEIKENHDMVVVDISATHMLRKPVVLKAVIIIAGLFCFREFTGYMATIFYGLNIVQDGGQNINAFGKFTDDFILGSSFIVYEAVSRRMHSKHNIPVRRGLLTSATAATTVLFFHTAYLYLMKNHRAINNIFRLFLTLALQMSYEYGWSFYPELIMFQYLPFQVFSKVRTMMTCLKWLSIFTMLTTVSLTQTSVQTTFVSYGIFSLISLLGVTFISVQVIETKGKTLAEVQKKLGGGPVGCRNARGLELLPI